MTFREQLDKLSTEGKIEVLLDIILSNSEFKKVSETYFDTMLPIGTPVLLKDYSDKYCVGFICKQLSEGKYEVSTMYYDGLHPIVHGEFDKTTSLEETFYYDNEEDDPLRTITKTEIVSVLPLEVFLYEVKTYFHNGKERKTTCIGYSFKELTDKWVIRFKKVKLVPKVTNYFM